MFNDVLTRANIKTRTLFERYCSIADEKTALIMACAEGGQAELVQPILDLEKTDQQILMEETYRHLVPRSVLYPEECRFALDDFVDNGDDDEIELIYPSYDTPCDVALNEHWICPSEDAYKNKNDDE